jgi:hypothetical protein
LSSSLTRKIFSLDSTATAAQTAAGCDACSLLIANLGLKEVCIGLSFGGGKVSRPDLAGGGVNYQAMIPRTCDLVTPVGVARRRSRNTERDEDANAQAKHYTFDVYFYVHNWCDVMLLTEN